MSPVDRKLIIRLKGPLVDQRHVPFKVLSTKLAATQQALFAIGSAMRGGGKRGPLKAEVAEGCELLFIAAHPGSLEILSEVAPPPPTLSPNGDLGLQALDHLTHALTAIQSKDGEQLASLFPDYSHRTRVLRSVTGILPEDESEYEVELQRQERCTALRPQLREVINYLVRDHEAAVPEEAVRTITGRLFRIEVGTGSRQLGVLSRNRKIECYFSPQDEPVYRDLVPGSLVEVEGRATLNEIGDVERIEEIIDARAIQLLPIHWHRVIYGNRRFVLHQPIQLAVDFQDGLWIHEYEPLRITAFAGTRGESLEAFRMEFAALWDYVAQEQDDRLTPDARLLKAQLRELVERDEPVA
jgi:hypothetical protein